MFIPHTDAERKAMLEAIGVNKAGGSFPGCAGSVPLPRIRSTARLTEMEAMAQAQDFAGANESTRDLICFLGAGAYNHYVPATVDAMIRRGEFYDRLYSLPARGRPGYTAGDF
jgi:glycine dehydrogenase subunit 1